MMIINTPRELAAVLRQGSYAWPGGYPFYFVTADGAVLSFDAVRDNYVLVARSVMTQHNDGWLVTAVDINWEDETLVCDHTGEFIPSAYGEDQ